MVKKDTAKHDIKVRFIDKEHIMVQKSRVSGYFAEDSKELVCTTKKPESEWLEIFIHEFSHYEQWKENSYTWKLSVLPDGEDSSDLLFSWINGSKDFSKKKLNEIVWRARMLELDCEKRAVKNIKKYKLPIDIYAYIQKANTYVLFHNYVKIYRKWWRRGHAPYKMKDVYSQFPDRFLKNYTNIAKKYVDLFNEYC